METVVCKKCKKIFNRISSKQVICQKCTAELDDAYHKVKDYLWKNRKASINQVAEDCDVSVAQLKRWVKEEKLEFSQESGVSFQCESCGKEIRSGRYCQSCKDKVKAAMENEVSKTLSILENMAKPNTIGFHTKE